MKTFLAVLLALVAVAQAAPDVGAITIIQLNSGSIRVEASITTNGSQTSVEFFYKLQSANPTDITPFPGGASAVAGSATPTTIRRDVLNLQGGRTYEFTVKATQAGDLTDQEIVTAVVNKYDPTFTSRVTTTSDGKATINGTVRPNGDDITAMTLDYGDSSAYPLSEPIALAPLLNATTDVAQPFTVTLTGLKRGITYHYRVRATTPDGDKPSLDNTFSIAANKAPIARPDTVRLGGGTSILIDVVANDTDPDGDVPLDLVSVTQGSQGKVTIVGEQVRYTPNPDAEGGDTFTYTIKDSYTGPGPVADEKLRKSATGTVTIIAPGFTSRGLHAAELKDADGNVVGLVRLYGTGAGGISGKVQLYSKTYTVHGEIGANGHFYYTIPQGDNPPFQLDVDYEPEGESAGAFDVSLASFEKSFSGTAIPNTLSDARRDEIVGKYTIEIPGGSGDGEPAGIGYAQVNVRPWGEVSLKGRLADGTKFSTKGVLAGSDTTPSVSLWFTPKESRVGLTFTFSEGTDPTITGQSRWYRGQERDAEFFPNGFYLEPAISGSRFRAPENNRSLDGGSKSTLTFKDGNIATDIVQQVEISKSDRVNFLNSNPYGISLNLNGENGTFKGEFDHPFDGSRRKFNGVIIQSQDKGSGMFIGIDQTGSVALTVGIANPTPTPAPTPTPTPTNPNIPGLGQNPGLDINF